MSMRQTVIGMSCRTASEYPAVRRTGVAGLSLSSRANSNPFPHITTSEKPMHVPAVPLEMQSTLKPWCLDPTRHVRPASLTQRQRMHLLLAAAKRIMEGPRGALLPWIVGRGGAMPLLGRLRTLDNLRHSLLAPTALMAAASFCRCRRPIVGLRSSSPPLPPRAPPECLSGPATSRRASRAPMISARLESPPRGCPLHAVEKLRTWGRRCQPW